MQLLSEFINPDDLLNLWQINKYGNGDEHTIAPTDGSVGYINDEIFPQIISPALTYLPIALRC